MCMTSGRRARLAGSVLAVALSGSGPGIGADVALVRDGRADARIVRLNASEDCSAAAAELRKYLSKMSGVDLPVAARGAPGVARTELLVGLSGDTGVPELPGQAQAASAMKREGFRIYAGADASGKPCVAVLGKDAAGMRFGVCELLERLGCRWYMPGELGENIPRKPTIVVPEMDEVQNPDFVLRNVWWAYGGRPAWQRAASTEWRRRNKMGGVQASMGHNLHRIVVPSRYGKTNLDFFPLRNGRRYIPQSDGEQGWQPCTSNPEVIELAARKAIAFFDSRPDAFAYSLSPADGYGWCECDACTAQDPVRFRGLTNRGKGRRMTIFANEVAKRLAARHPDKHVCWYAYAGTVEAPDDVHVHPNVVISLAHYGWCGCNVHALADKRCRLNPKFLEILNAWSGKTDKLFIREYWTTLVGATDMPARVCAAYSLAEDIPLFKSKGVIGFSSESIPDYGAAALNFWMAARKMWNAEADTDALLDDFYTGMYGPASQAMRAFFEHIVEHCRRVSCRGPYFDESRLAELRRMLDEAEGRCRTDKQRARVGQTRQGLDYAAAMREYVIRPTGRKRAAVLGTLTRLEKSHSLAVDFVSQRAQFGRKTRASTPAAEKLCGAKLRPYTRDQMPAGEAEKAFTVRGVHCFVLLADAGESVTGRVEVRRLGRYLSPCAYVLLGPDGGKLAEGEASIGETAEIDVRAVKSGVHVLVLNTGRNAARACVWNQYFCLAGATLRLLGAQPAAYVHVPPGAKGPTVKLSSDATGNPEAPGETAMMIVRDAAGRETARGDTVSGKAFEVALPVYTTAEGQVWEIRLTKASRGILEDLRLELGPGCTSFVATHPARLLIPQD